MKRDLNTLYQDEPKQGESAQTISGRAKAKCQEQDGLQDYTVAAAYVCGLLNAAESLGLQRQHLLAASDIDPEELTVPSNRVALDCFLALADDTAAQSGRDDIGLLMAMQAKPGTFSALGYAAMSCENLLQAAMLIPRYEDVVVNAGITEIGMTGDASFISWVAKHEVAAKRPLQDVVVAGWYCYARWLTNIEEHEPIVVKFCHPKPKNVEPYETLFRCPVEFGASKNEIQFDSKFLTVPLVHVDHEFNHLMKEKADVLMSQLAGQGTVRQQVIDILREMLPKHEASVSMVASSMNMSERTLRRRLADEDCSFLQVLTEVRVRLANLYLRKSELSILDVALLLGYSDQSAFSSAFKGWHGMSPSAWRNQELSD